MKRGKVYKIKLKLNSPFHLGRKEKTHGSVDTISHSDTLFSGIMNCHSLLYGDERTTKLVQAFLEGQPPFRISSTMPYINDIFFVFKPLGMNLKIYAPDEEEKKLKKAKYIPEENLLNGFKGSFTTVGELFVKKEDADKLTPFAIPQERVRVSLDRTSSASNVYYFPTYSYHKNSGLWFYIEILDESVEKEIFAAIKLLGDEGLGGDRSIGLGFFELATAPVPMDLPFAQHDETQLYTTLSLVNPRKGEAEKFRYYDIVNRSGYLYSKGDQGIKRKAVRMFIEGSVFEGEAFGRAVDVTPPSFKEHPALRYGLTFPVPLPKEVSFIDNSLENL
ncbi:type III-A CRISPR-associated RAMP protein Csm4 [Pseudothermotoga thermarum]|uniref:CRISPR system Cms protein Csm4 n=1 Tax=Pseudothermotoga thermarum DSM 5069 TaxID=688269 RepID=F7YTN0_9THEM|nr:type III-A CRISPR-associated RAMP protein Csm4 [Pseudothermotoga thermarum]AEH51252.1 CRISPR-associated RAMP protein, Csm4 family [Pseudothermotoga thermarum DSM 5069]